MGKFVAILNIPFDRLIPKRELDDGMFHCVCQCGRYRTVSRKRLLDKSVHACVECAKEARRSAGGRQHRPEMPAEPIQVKPEQAKCKPGCTVRLIDGRVYVGHDPDCPRFGLFSAILPRRIDTRVYPMSM